MGKLDGLKKVLIKDINSNSWDFDGVKWVRANALKNLLGKRIKAAEKSL